MVSEERISKFGKQFSVGSNHQCKVVQFNYMDNTVVVSLQKYVYVCACIHVYVLWCVHVCVLACVCICAYLYVGACGYYIVYEIVFLCICAFN